MNTTPEQMRGEFRDAYPNIVAFRDDGPYSEFIADWWLSQFEAYKEELRATLEADKPDLSKHEGSHSNLRFWQGYQKGIEHARTLLSTPVPEGEGDTKDPIANVTNEE